MFSNFSDINMQSHMIIYSKVEINVFIKIFSGENRSVNKLFLYVIIGRVN